MNESVRHLHPEPKIWAESGRGGGVCWDLKGESVGFERAADARANRANYFDQQFPSKQALDFKIYIFLMKMTVTQVHKG